MKVMCIDGIKAGAKGTFGTEVKKSDEVYEGEAYTVVTEVYNGRGYLLSGKFHSYLKKRFIPLSEIDEMEYTEHKTLTAC